MLAVDTKGRQTGWVHHGREPMNASHLRVYYGPQEDTANISVAETQRESVTVPLMEIMPLLADAVQSQRDLAARFRGRRSYHLDGPLRSHPSLPALPPPLGLVADLWVAVISGQPSSPTPQASWAGFVSCRLIKSQCSSHTPCAEKGRHTACACYYQTTAASTAGRIKIFPSPIRPVRDTSTNTRTISSRLSSSTQRLISTLGK